MRRFITLIVLAAIALPAHGETVDLGHILSGKVFPLSMSLKELDGNWRRFTATGSDPAPSAYTQMIGLMTSRKGMGAYHYYTKGYTVPATGGETYLVAYSPLTQPFDPSVFTRSEPPELQKLTPDTVLSLSLLNLRSIGSLTDIRPFDLNAEISDGSEGNKDKQSGPANSQESLKAVGLAFLMYTSDHDDVFPPMNDPATARRALAPYAPRIDDGKVDIFVQPDTNRLYIPNKILSKRKHAHIKNPAEMVMFYEGTPDKNGFRNVVYVDGHVKRLSESEWQVAKRQSKIP